MSLTEKKKKSRRDDQARIQSGAATPEQVQAENSVIPTETSNDPKWKTDRVNNAIKGLTQPKSSLPKFQFKSKKSS